MFGVKRQGFTLIELIVVIMVLGTVSISVVSFIRFGVTIYQDGIGRERQIAESRFLIERLSRELREALPNSVRVSGGGQCVEFMPIISSSSYLDIPVQPETAASSIEVVAGTSLPTSAIVGGNLKMSVYPSNSLDVYVDATTTGGKLFAISGLSAVSGNKRTISLANSVQFDIDSPTQRYFIVDNPIAYCQGSGNKVYRHQGYSYSDSFTQLNPPGSGVLMAQLQTNQTPFQLLQATPNHNSVVLLDFEFSYDDETLRIYNEVHIVNVP